MRAPTEPNLPTVAEAGFPALTLDGLVGLFGPSGMPLALRERIAADMRAAADPIIKDRLTKSGQIMNIGGPEEFAKSIDGAARHGRRYRQAARYPGGAMRMSRRNQHDIGRR